MALTEDGSRMLIWDMSTMGTNLLFGAGMTSDFELELASSLEFENGFTATTVLHPATYLNKVLVASSEGNMQLWNIRTQ